MMAAISLSALPGTTFGPLFSVLPRTPGQRNGYPYLSEEGKVFKSCELQFLVNKMVVAISVMRSVRIGCEMYIKPQQNVLRSHCIPLVLTLRRCCGFQFQGMKCPCTMTPWSRSWSCGLQIARRPWPSCGTAFVSTTWVTGPCGWPWCFLYLPSQACPSRVVSLCPCHLISTNHPYVTIKFILCERVPIGLRISWFQLEKKARRTETSRVCVILQGNQ